MSINILMIELFLRFIPESILMFYGIDAITDYKLDRKKVTISIVAYLIAMLLIRSMSIVLGVQTILLLFALNLICIIYNKIDALKSIKCTMIIFVIMYIAEAINMIGIKLIFKDISFTLVNTTSKVIFSAPSLMLAFIIIIIYKKTNIKIKL